MSSCLFGTYPGLMKRIEQSIQKVPYRFGQVREQDGIHVLDYRAPWNAVWERAWDFEYKVPFVQFTYDIYPLLAQKYRNLHKRVIIIDGVEERVAPCQDCQ